MGTNNIKEPRSWIRSVGSQLAHERYYIIVFSLSYSWLFFLQLFSCWITTCISGSCSLRNRGLGLVKTSGILWASKRSAAPSSSCKSAPRVIMSRILGKGSLPTWTLGFFLIFEQQNPTNIVVNDSSIFSGPKKNPNRATFMKLHERAKSSYFLTV